MKIWSFQSDSCVDTLASGEIYYADINKSDFIIEERAKEGGDTIFLDSYNFMTKHMKQNVNPLIPAEYSEIFLEISAPVWGWYKTNGKNSRPDRRTYLFKDMDTEGVSLIHLDVPDEYVTLTDFYLWETFAINKTKFYDKNNLRNLCSCVFEKDTEYCQHIESFIDEIVECRDKKELECSWGELFNEKYFQDNIQATFPFILPQWVRKIEKL